MARPDGEQFADSVRTRDLARDQSKRLNGVRLIGINT